MLAQPIKEDKHKIGGYYMSEKLDGGRCFWDGGLTRGLATSSVPWAGLLNPKTGQPKKKIKPVATGLWSRYGNPIMAPDWFLNTLPCTPLDGELWAGRGNFQKVMSCVRKDKPVDEQWKEITYGIFGAPDFKEFGKDGEIKNSNQLTDVRGVAQWMDNLHIEQKEDWVSLSGTNFGAELANLNEWVDNFNETTFLIHQTKLPADNDEAMIMALEFKMKVITGGGEGVFLRNPAGSWAPERNHDGLKMKGVLDDEGIVTGFTAGRETDKGSKLLGRIGALVLDYKGQRLELSGLNYEEREFSNLNGREWATENPGTDMPPGTEGKHFKKGDKVTFLYRELSDTGIPKEARYFRKRS
jgi:DNA ligase-1